MKWCCDWSAPLLAWLVGALSFVARLPNALAGLGFDGDSGLFVVRAMLSVERGEYLPSRPPGYFIPDLFAQLLAGYGAHWLCLLHSAIYACTVPVFAALLRELQLPARGWLIWAYAFLPLGWVACSDVMVEYALCLLGLLLGWLYTLRGAPLLAGLWLGWGAAMRPSQGMFLLIVFIIYWFLLWGWRRGTLSTTVAAAAVMALWVLPVWLLTGRWQTLISYLPYEASLQQHLLRAGGRLVGAVGLIGLVVWGLALLSMLFSIPRSRVHTLEKGLCLVASSVIVLLFLRHPFKMNYLLLGMPFALIGAGWAAHSRLIPLLVGVLLAHNFVSLPSVGRLSTRQDIRLIGAGVAIRDWTERRTYPKHVEAFIQQADAESIVGVQEPTVWLLGYEALRGKRPAWRAVSSLEVLDAAKQRRFVLIGTPESAEYWRRRGKKLYLSSGAYFRLMRDFGYDATQRGYRILPTSQVGL